MEDEEPLLRHRGGGSGVDRADNIRRREHRTSFRTTSQTAVGNSSGFIPEQFMVRPAPVPYRSIALGCFLFLCGTFSLYILVTDLWRYLGSTDSELISRMRDAVGLFGETIDKEETDQEVLERVTGRLWSLGILAFVSLTPGLYIVFLTTMVLLKQPGYSFNDIPS